MKTDVGEVAGGNERATEAGYVEDAQADLVLLQNTKNGVIDPRFVAKLKDVLILWR